MGTGPEKLFAERSRWRRLGREERVEGRAPTRRFCERSRWRRDLQEEMERGREPVRKLYEKERKERLGRLQRRVGKGPERLKLKKSREVMEREGLQVTPDQLHGVVSFWFQLERAWEGSSKESLICCRMWASELGEAAINGDLRRRKKKKEKKVERGRRTTLCMATEWE